MNTKVHVVIVGGVLLVLGLGVGYMWGDRQAYSRGYQKAAADVKTAQEEAQEKICTQETALLSCGRDPSFIYEASNGCEKSYLEGKGWK